eukprot:SAG31_NODE_3091_length_4683_cov_47.153578_7_plen_156_part_00
MATTLSNCMTSLFIVLSLDLAPASAVHRPNLQHRVLTHCLCSNLAYAIGLSERVRRRVEAFGLVELGDAEASALQSSKVEHLGLLIMVVPSCARFMNPWLVLVLPGAIVFGLGGVAEAVRSGSSAGEVCNRIALSCSAWLFGLVTGVTFCVIAIQ